jgi:capsular exopolysaccharide synthesis family protein
VSLRGQLGPGNQQAEAFRVLRSNLNVALADLNSPIVLITSALANEGKTSTTVNLAVSFAMSGRRVILVDLDLRRPDMYRWLGAHNEFGVADVLLDRRSLEEALQYVEVGHGPDGTARGTYFLSAGTASNPTELLGTQRTGRLLKALAGQADLVLIDSPPVLLVADTLVIGRMAAGAVLVVESRRTAVPVVEQAKDALIRNQTRILGVVVNKFQAKDSPYTHAYGYGYAAETDDEESSPPFSV